MADEAPIPAPAPVTGPDVKPGYKTTEFWLSTAAMLVGTLLSLGVFPSEGPVMKILGVAAIVLSLLGYQVTRAGVKKAAAILLIVFVPVLLASCNKGMVRADAIQGLNSDVCDRHDRMIRGQLDPKTLSEADRATYLRSSELLRKALREAQE